MNYRQIFIWEPKQFENILPGTLYQCLQFGCQVGRALAANTKSSGVRMEPRWDKFPVCKFWFGTFVLHQSAVLVVVGCLWAESQRSQRVFPVNPHVKAAFDFDLGCCETRLTPTGLMSRQLFLSTLFDLAEDNRVLLLLLLRPNAEADFFLTLPFNYVSILR